MIKSILFAILFLFTSISGAAGQSPVQVITSIQPGVFGGISGFLNSTLKRNYFSHLLMEYTDFYKLLCWFVLSIALDRPFQA